VETKLYNEERRQRHVDDAQKLRGCAQPGGVGHVTAATEDVSSRLHANAVVHHALRLMYRTPEPPVIRRAQRGIGEHNGCSVTAFVRCKNCLIIVAARRRHILLSFCRVQRRQNRRRRLNISTTTTSSVNCYFEHC